MKLFCIFSCNLLSKVANLSPNHTAHFMNKSISRSFWLTILFFGLKSVSAQVSSVEFGKNRVQYQKFNWKFYQTENFNTYFSQDGLELGKYVAQIAEKELPQLEEFMEYTFRQKVKIVVYNNFGEFK